MIQKRQCVINDTLDFISSKWTLLILRELLGGSVRFGELLARLQGISPKTLTLRLKELEARGIASRIVYPVIPPHVEYALTEKGKDLHAIFLAVQSWTDKWEQGHV